MLKTILIIALGGAVGSVLRFLTSLLVNKFWSNYFPLATFLTNVLGCFLIGYFFGILEKLQLTNSDIKGLLITGFCGGFTTFSTFGLESLELFQNQNSFSGILYISLSLILGLMAVSYGLFVAKM